MIHFVLVLNNLGQTRLAKFYTKHFESHDKQQEFIKSCFPMVSHRDASMCNFLPSHSSLPEGVTLVYRQYATLYFIFAADEAENPLGILDLIQVFVEALDRSFQSVSELDIVFHPCQVHFILDQMITGGLVLETNPEAIIANAKKMDDYAAASHVAEEDSIVTPNQ